MLLRHHWLMCTSYCHQCVGRVRHRNHAVVGLANVSHTFPDDIDMLPPAWPFCSCRTREAAATLAASTSCSVTAPPPVAKRQWITSGRFRPSNYTSAPVDALPAPAPEIYGSGLTNLNGSTVNGTWSLFVNDALAPDVGSIGAWKITIFTDDGGLPVGLNPVPCGKPDFDGTGALTLWCIRRRPETDT